MNRKIISFTLFIAALFVLSCSVVEKRAATTSKQLVCAKNTETPCWRELKNIKQCYTYSSQPLPEEAVTWSGKCKNERAEGKGKLIWYLKGKEYSVYDGTMHLGVRDGKGTYKTAKYQYKGEYKNDLSDGYGEIATTTHESYQGYWEKGKMNGKGKLVLANGISLVGEWKEGYLNGQATVRNPNAHTTYIGEMKNSQKHGKGKLVFDNGDVWLTTCRDGQLDGEVIVIKKDGRKMKTVWKKGKLIHAETTIEIKILDTGNQNQEI